MRAVDLFAGAGGFTTGEIAAGMAKRRAGPMFLLDTNQDYEHCAAELAVTSEAVGQLLTPLTQFSDRSRPHFAIDNGAFANFDRDAFLALLGRQESEKHRCLFVAVPDVVGSARRTLELFEWWAPALAHWPLAFVLQDGQQDARIPWADIAAVFVGGTDGFKTSPASEQCIKAAKALGKWVHVGRVNTPDRVLWAERVGADSVDGSGISRYSHMRKQIAAARSHPTLPLPDSRDTGTAGGGA